MEIIITFLTIVSSFLLVVSGFLLVVKLYWTFKYEGSITQLNDKMRGGTRTFHMKFDMIVFIITLAWIITISIIS